jgi:hypothetical protein
MAEVVAALLPKPAAAEAPSRLDGAPPPAAAPVSSPDHGPAA